LWRETRLFFCQDTRHEICEKENRISIITRCFVIPKKQKKTNKERRERTDSHGRFCKKRERHVQYSTHTGTHAHSKKKMLLSSSSFLASIRFRITQNLACRITHTHTIDNVVNHIFFFFQIQGGFASRV
jgi:hypothetical protein